MFLDDGFPSKYIDFFDSCKTLSAALTDFLNFRDLQSWNNQYQANSLKTNRIRKTKFWRLVKYASFDFVLQRIQILFLVARMKLMPCRNSINIH